MMTIKNKRYYSIVVLMALMLLGFPSWSQDCDDNIISEAEKNYEIGLFVGIKDMLQPCIDKGFSPKQLVKAYRLISVSYLAVDSLDQAILYANKLLALKPDFDAELSNNPKFEEIINDIKRAGSSLQIVSVSKRAENVYEAPATVMIISREEIMNRGYVDLEQVFSDLPGFDVSRTMGTTYSNIYQRGYRSNNTDRTLFLVDGVEENDLWSNISYWSRQYPISNVERIEVLYGPASTMYGANALVGVINVITRDPEVLAGKNQIGVKVNTGGGSYDTKFLDMTVAAKRNNMSFSTTVKRFSSSEQDLSGYPEFNYSPSDYDLVDYAALLDVNDKAADFVKLNNLSANNPYFTINQDANGDTVSISLTQEGANAARDHDKEALNAKLNGNQVGYSNRSEHWYLNGKAKFNNLQIGYEFWESESGGTNYFTDNKSAGADNGTKWVPKQSFFYMKYDNNISDKLSLMNFTQYRVTQVNENSSTIYINNYSNGALNMANLAVDKDPYWKSQHYYQISRQFRNEFKMTYNPNAALNLVSGVEIRNSSIQGDYRTTAYVYDNLADPDPVPPSPSVIETGTSSGDSAPGGNDFSIYDIGAYVQGTWKFNDIYMLTLGGRYDYNRIRVTGGYGSQFNPRVALVVTPGNFILKAIYASAFQNASNWTKFATISTRLKNNPTLDPEKVSNFDFSIAYRFSKNIYADLVYYRSIFNGVVGTGFVQLEDGTTTGQNQAIGALKIQGLQSNFSAKIDNYTLYANFTYTDPQNNILENGELTNTYQRIGDIASIRSNLGVNASYFDHLNVNFRMNYAGKRPVGSNTTVSANPGNFPATFLFNSAIMYKEILPGFSVQLIVNNLFDLEYSDPGIRSADGKVYSYRTPQRGRNFLIQLIYDL
ncbi:MAG: TonB-dependent receptor [Bacteroidales bacterium]|nr:TonB-dependent receptor [Bacteroidales bacterium]MCF8454290.1 TonB-dependent receptor [Bacteroidales bacterium]